MLGVSGNDLEVDPAMFTASRKMPPELWAAVGQNHLWQTKRPDPPPGASGPDGGEASIAEQTTLLTASPVIHH
eukprot:4754966-Pyramimonas_sp.AAC.1